MTEPRLGSTDDEGSSTERRDSAVGDPERIAEEWAERVGRWIARTAVRAREDAEDIWAEAKELRRRL